MRRGVAVEEARFALERIAEVDPKPGEYEELEEQLPRSEHAEVLVATANDAHASLAAEGGALDAVNGAVAELSRMATVDRKLGDIADAFRMPAFRLRIAPTSCVLIAMALRLTLASWLVCANGIPTSRVCCVSGVPPWTMYLPCAIARKSCCRW